jgi:hypothetical protein
MNNAGGHMKSLSILIILMLILFGISVVKAEVYTWVDENGVRHYGDSPPEEAEDAKVMFPEYQYDEAADKNRGRQDKQQLKSLIKDIEADNAEEQAAANKKAQQAQQNKKPTRQELIATEKARLEEKIAFLEEQPLEYFGSQRNKIVRIGYYRYQIEDLIKDPDKYFNQPASFEGNVKEPAGSDPGNASGAAGY